MLCNELSIAKKYTKNPVILAVSEQPKETLYYVPDSSLPALSCSVDPFSLLTHQELFELKKKYRAPQSLIRKMRQAYSEECDTIELGDDVSLEKKLFCENVEDIILSKIKHQYRNQSANFFPYYDPKETSQRTLHTLVVGSSSVGKSWTTSQIIQRNFNDSSVSACYIFSPTAKSDPSWQNLRKALGKKCKLINSNEVSVCIPLSQIAKGSIVVVDDPDSTTQPSKDYILQLMSEILYHGRHHSTNNVGCTVFSICHDAWANNIGTRSSTLEASRIILFPLLNKSVATKFLSKRCHYTAKEIKRMFNFLKRGDRWACIYQHYPNCLICKHGALLL